MTAIPVGAVCGLKVDSVKGWGEEHVGSPSHGPHPTPLTTVGVGAQATVYRRLPHGQTELLQAYVDDNVSASPATWSQRQPPGYGRQCVWQRALRPTKSRQAHAANRWGLGRALRRPGSAQCIEQARTRTGENFCGNGGGFSIEDRHWGSFRVSPTLRVG